MTVELARWPFRVSVTVGDSGFGWMELNWAKELDRWPFWAVLMVEDDNLGLTELK